MSDRRYASVSAILAILSVAALVVEPVTANAQPTPEGYHLNPAPPPSDQYPQGAPPQNPGPPPQGADAAPAPGQYPPYAQPPGGGAQAYNQWVYRQAYRDWQIRYAQWFEHYCVNRHTRNTVAGALIGGGFGAFLAAAIAGPWYAGGWALFGGLTGATAGAAIGASVRPAACPGGYYASGGPRYGPGPAYGPPRGYGYGPPPDRAPDYPVGPPPND